jgi:flagellar basal-body rod protein FlgG
MRALDTATTGMTAMDLQVQVIAGNLANMTTTGFKSQRAEFQDLIYEHVQRIGAQASDNGNILPVGIELGSGVKAVGTPRLMTQGTLAQTGNTCRHSGLRLVQDPDARRHIQLYARRFVPDG